MSLVTRFTVLWSFLTAALVALFGFLNYRGSREHLMATWRDTLAHDATTTVLRVQSTAQEAARDAQYLATTPTVREYVRSFGAPAERERWRSLVAENFRALLAGKPDYFQVRLIGADDGGRELVRLDNDRGLIELIPEDRLQRKGDRDYVQAGLRLSRGEVYLSDINLNQDFGQITEPHIPTLRSVAAVPGEDGRAVGVVVVNVDLGGLFAALPTQTSPGVSLELANEQGDFLVHPDAERRFGSDLGRPSRFSDAGRMIGRSSTDLSAAQSFPAMPGQERQWHIRVTARENEFLSGLAGARNRALGLTALAALGGVAVVLLSGRWLSQRLQTVTEAVAGYESGQEIESLPPPGNDEIGLLATKFRELAGKVRDDVTKLETARREAEEAARARDDFLAMMSHEIRTPMNAIVGLLRVLDRNRPAPHQEPILASLRSASRQLLSLVNEALDHSKIKAGKVEFMAADFSLPELLHDMALTHRPLAVQKGLSFSLELDPVLPARLRGDAVRLGQVLNNLIGNAVKFTDRGNITVRGTVIDRLSAAALGGCAAAVVTAADAAPVWIEFLVMDSGIGIAEENIGRIFAPFDQEHGEIGRRFGGTGLGLSIVRSLVELQGGVLDVESRRGEGSSFRVRMPFGAALEGSPEIASGKGMGMDLRGRRVLYIEDVASNREVMAAALADSGVSLTFAETGAEGLAAARGERFDLVLVDLQLPDMNGLELAAALHPEQPGLPLLAVTAQVSAEVRSQCLDGGLRGVVGKPFTPETLFAGIAECLAGPVLAGSTDGGTTGPSIGKSEGADSQAASGPSPGGPLGEGNGSDDGMTDGPASALTRLFPREPERVQRLLRLLATEFAQHERDLGMAITAQDLPSLRQLRHRLHSALLQLHLQPLRTALDQLLVTPEAPVAQEAARDLLRDAQQALEAAAPG